MLSGKIHYRPNFLLGGMTFKHKTPLLKSNYSTENTFYRKRYAGTFILVFTEYPILFQIRASILFSTLHIWSIGKKYQFWMVSSIIYHQNKNVLDSFYLCPGITKLWQYSLYHWNSKILKQLAACQGILFSPNT